MKSSNFIPLPHLRYAFFAFFFLSLTHAYSQQIVKTTAVPVETLILDKYRSLQTDILLRQDGLTLFRPAKQDRLYASRITALFCVLEKRQDNYSGIPLRLRLGSLDYVNHLERKDSFNSQELTLNLYQKLNGND